jgi:hypothetical protein
MAAQATSESKQLQAAAVDAHADFYDGLEGAALLRNGQKAALDALLAELQNKRGDGQHAGKKRRVDKHN